MKRSSRHEVLVGVVVRDHFGKTTSWRQVCFSLENDHIGVADGFIA